MHLSSLDKMRSFRQQYLSGKEDQDLTIFDLGCTAIGGSYREIFAGEKWKYMGLDLAEGDNVDLVLSDPYNWLEIDSESVDVLVSGQAFEHIEYFWKTMGEIARVLKPEGLCCIIAPSGGPEHKYPVDCWRFYPDGFRALARYAGIETVEVGTQWTPEGYNDGSDLWADTRFIGRKQGKKVEKVEEIHTYRREVRQDSEDSLGKILRRVKSGSRVLELGPATGYLTRVLKERLNCRVDCVEISPEMAREAAPFCERMLVADLDRILLEEELKGEEYDCILLADVLEHLGEGERTLRSCGNLLKEDGRLILSVPNIAHASIVGELLKGRFDYTDEGLLDRSHLRFFTRASVEKLLGECGFAVETAEAVIKMPEETEVGDSLTDLPFELQKAILYREEALAYQFVLVSRRAEEGEIRFSPDLSLDGQDPVDLRRLVLTHMEERLRKAEEELEYAQKLVSERLDRIHHLEERLGLAEEELKKAQRFAYERLDRIQELERAFHEAQDLAFQRLDRMTAMEEVMQRMDLEVQAYRRTLEFRIRKKAKEVLGRASS
jgi:SAM-dependent methyltransferase